MIVMWLFLVVPYVCLHFVIVVVPDHIHLLFSTGHLLLEHIMYEIKVKLTKAVRVTDFKTR